MAAKLLCGAGGAIQVVERSVSRMACGSNEVAMTKGGESGTTFAFARKEVLDEQDVHGELGFGEYDSSGAHCRDRFDQHGPGLPRAAHAGARGDHSGKR